MAGVIDKYAAGMFKRQEQYAQRVKGLYDVAVGKLTALAAQIPYDPDHEFSFSDNPRIADETTRIIRELYSQVYNQIKSGVEAEWELANLSCDALITSIFGTKIKETNLGAQWFARNQKAMDAFFARKSANEGLNLSQKVWKYTGDLRTELENAISVSMGEGVSAATMSRRVRQYLRVPDKLFRRVKGKDGKLHLSKAAKAYHPSRGVYRSSYKNAMRLTRTETNMAYRMADEDRWQRMDFVVGYEVKTSNNHPEPDICDDLKGKYPKGFVFKGWHPQCRCRIVPILATKGEFINLQRIAISGGDARGFVSKNHVASVPSGFTKWIKKNEKRILAAKSKPYFIRDNFIGGDIRNGLTNAVLKAGLMPKNGTLPTIKNVTIDTKSMSVDEIAKARHAKRDDAAIQTAWGKRLKEGFESQIAQMPTIATPSVKSRLKEFKSAVKKGNADDIRAAYENIKNAIQTQIAALKRHAARTNAQASATLDAWNLRYIGRNINRLPEHLMNAAQDAINKADAKAATKVLEDAVAHKQSTISSYVADYKKRSKAIKALSRKVNSGKLNALERFNVANELQEKCAILTRWDLRKCGAIDGLDFVGLDTNYSLKGMGSDVVYIDMIKFKDKYGKEFSYPIGATKDSIEFSASEASKIINSMADYLKDNITGVTFVGRYHPLDKLYRRIYKKFTHGAMYSSDPVSVHVKYYSVDSFKGSLTHEIGHHLDVKADWRNNAAAQRDWDDAVRLDKAFPSLYAKNNGNIEDFAESIKFYVADKTDFKKRFPNRARILENEIRRLGYIP